MATHDPHAHTANLQYCTHCGTSLGTGPFCPGCGQPAVAQTQTPFPRNEAAQQQAAQYANGYGHDPYAQQNQNAWAGGYNAGYQPAKPGGSNTWMIFAAVGVLVVGAIAIGLILLLDGSDSKSSGSGNYSQKVTSTFAPVDTANQRLSDALAQLSSGGPATARSAAAQAEDATSSARGALSTLAVPNDSQQLAGQARQALDRESSYLSAVSAVLAHPSSDAVSDLRTLSGNLTSSLEAAGAPLAGSAQHVSGVDGLTTWAQHARRTAAHKRTQMQQGSGGGSAPAPSPLANGRNCGGGLFAGPNTTCAFAENVRQAWAEAPGVANTIEVFSPATGQTYTMNCRPAGDAITCSGGNNASVSFGT